MQRVFNIDEASQIADARRQATELARAAGFDETDRGRVALIVTEASTNILKHAGHGQILVRMLLLPQNSGVEVIAVDHGPGLADSVQSFADGHSTTGTSGTGLGALARMSEEFDWYSHPDAGSVFRMALWPGRIAPAAQGLEVGAICVPMPGEHVAGDDWGMARAGNRAVIMVADGLGHGVDAFRASRAATDLLAGRENWSTTELLEEAHGVLRATRGAAVSVAALNLDTGSLQFSGIGNVAAVLRGYHGRQQLITHNGIVGHNMRRAHAVETVMPPGTMLLLHSDGLTSQWNLDIYPGLEMRHPAVMAAVLYKEHWRKRDDVTVVVVRRP